MEQLGNFVALQLTAFAPSLQTSSRVEVYLGHGCWLAAMGDVGLSLDACL